MTINTTTVAQDKTVTYGAASVLLTATVTPATGPAVNSGTVTFTVNGSSVTSGPVSAGNASASFSLSGLNAGSYNIAATYNPGSGFNGSNNSGQSPTPKLTVNKATTTTTVTCTGGPFGYTGSAQTPCSATVTGAGGLNQAVLVTYSNNVSAGTATANASFAENTNYLASSDFENFTIGLAELTISAEDQSKTYGDTVVFDTTSPSADFSVVGLVNADTVTSVTLTSAGAAAGATVALSPYTIVIGGALGTGLGNYEITYENGSLTVDKAELTISAEDQSKTYGDTVVFDTTSPSD